jgi:N-acetylglucosaminyl-diphospho-decaprenol L-rhamnosyltransferase
MIDLDVIIVNWNSGTQIHECLQSIAQASPDTILRVQECVVVDNASTDGSLDGLEDVPLPTTIIRNPENMGFATASNQGARIGNSGYILFLNPDLMLSPDSLEKPLLFLEKQENSQVGILGIQFIDKDGVIQRNAAHFPTPGTLYKQILGLSRIWSHRFSPHFMSDWDHREDREVDQVQGAFFLVRRKVFELLKGFDERFFMYFEDLDFAYRARLAGWKSYYLANPRAMHLFGKASNQVKFLKLSYFLKSRVLYASKHFGRLTALGILFASLAIEFWLRLGWSLISKTGEGFRSTLQGYALFIRDLPGLLKACSGE